MEGKVLLQDLAQSLAARRKMQRKDAEAFLKAFFETISTGILQDKTVKIKGLGTFKMIEVQDRESVNVNTGERIVIPGHSKITFTPDSELKDEVNRPFALFQTVIINEGTSIEEMEKVETPADVPDENVEDSEPSFVEDVPGGHPVEPSVVEEIPVPGSSATIAGEVELQAVAREESVVTDTPVVQEKPTVQEEPAKAETPVGRSEETKAAEPVAQSVAPDARRHSWWYVEPAMTALLFAFFWIVFLAGYFAGSKNWHYLENIFNKPAQNPVVQIDTVFVEKIVQPDSIFIKGMEDSIRNVISEEGKVRKDLPKDQVRQPVKPEPKPQPVATAEKTRVTFEIVGYKGVRTIQWGDYLLKIVRQEYGTDDALRYVISYNNFTDPDNLPVGTEVKLPKLKQK